MINSHYVEKTTGFCICIYIANITICILGCSLVPGLDLVPSFSEDHFRAIFMKPGWVWLLHPSAWRMIFLEDFGGDYIAWRWLSLKFNLGIRLFQENNLVYFLTKIICWNFFIGNNLIHFVENKLLIIDLILSETQKLHHLEMTQFCSIDTKFGILILFKNVTALISLGCKSYFFIIFFIHLGFQLTLH